MRKKLILFVLSVFLLPYTASAQFGKNQVIWEKTTWTFYQSAHFDFYISLDIKDDDVQKHLTGLVAHLEGSYEFLGAKLGHGLKKRPIVVVSRTHSTFEALHLAGGEFMPEGVGAYALPRGSNLMPDTELLLVIKPDFLPMLNRTIYTHELVHIFQFDMIGWSFIGRAGGNNVEQWLFEATADYLANKYAPYSRDDIRKMEQRMAAANVKNPQTGLPTLEMLSRGQANPYSLGAMPFMFLEDKYSESIVMSMIVSIFKQRGQKFTELLADVSQGAFTNAEAFDRAHRDYWSAKYTNDSLERPRPYQETPSVKGRQVIKQPYPYPITSPTVSRMGDQVAFMTYNQKNGIVLAVTNMLPREDPPHVPLAKRKKYWLFGSQVSVQTPSVKVLTTFMPPKHYEYIIAQELNVWPFNGSDIDWWQKPDWIVRVNYIEQMLDDHKQTQIKLKEILQAKAGDHSQKLKALEGEIKKLEKTLADLKQMPDVNKIAFFARKNKDHALFVLDINTGKFLHQIELPLDQAFSPSFSVDGKFVYFSAAKNIQRDLHCIYLEKKEYLGNVTNGGVFNSAPSVSPYGSKIAYVAFVGGYQKLFLFDLVKGTKKQLTFGRWNDNSPSWSADSSLLAYTSDEKDQIWNLYTLNVKTGVSSQWTDYYGGVFTPKFAQGENDRIVFSTFLEEDQYRSFVYPNFDLFDVRLKEPLRTTQVESRDENMELAFRSQEVVSEQLDRRQLEEPADVPARWKLYGSNVSIGRNTYWGTFGSSRFVVQDVLANRTHAGLYAQQGDFKYIDYTYSDRSRRWGWGGNVTHTQYPIRYFLYSFEGEYPRYPSPNGDRNQFVLENTWAKETSAMFQAEYPFNKWNRLELGVRPRKRTYFLPITDSDVEMFGDQIPEIDRQFYDIFKNTTDRVNIGLTTAFVRDTVLYSNNTLGPLHGDAMRVQVEYGPGLNKNSAAYLTAQADIRKYVRLTNSTVFAVRAAGMNSNRPNGDFILLGGNDTLRNYPYMSVAGNQVGYGSAELRLPVADVALFSAIPFRVRGVLFGDYAMTRFSNQEFKARREWAYGFGLQANVFMPMNFEWAKTRFAPDKWNFNFRIGFNF